MKTVNIPCAGALTLWTRPSVEIFERIYEKCDFLWRTRRKYAQIFYKTWKKIEQTSLTQVNRKLTQIFRSVKTSMMHYKNLRRFASKLRKRQWRINVIENHTFPLHRYRLGQPWLAKSSKWPINLRVWKDMSANVQSGHVVTRAEPYKPKATLWHKGSGSGKDIIR